MSLWETDPCLQLGVVWEVDPPVHRSQKRFEAETEFNESLHEMLKCWWDWASLEFSWRWWWSVQRMWHLIEVVTKRKMNITPWETLKPVYLAVTIRQAYEDLCWIGCQVVWLSLVIQSSVVDSTFYLDILLGSLKMYHSESIIFYFKF